MARRNQKMLSLTPFLSMDKGLHFETIMDQENEYFGYFHVETCMSTHKTFHRYTHNTKANIVRHFLF